MSWSYRKRGTVQRTHMKTNRKNPVFIANMSIVASVFNTLYGPTLSHCVKGISHPPKNRVAVRPLTVAILAYSAMKNIENFMPLYSV